MLSELDRLHEDMGDLIHAITIALSPYSERERWAAGGGTRRIEELGVTITRIGQTIDVLGPEPAPVGFAETIAMIRSAHQTAHDAAWALGDDDDCMAFWEVFWRRAEPRLDVLASSLRQIDEARRRPSPSRAPGGSPRPAAGQTQEVAWDEADPKFTPASAAVIELADYRVTLAKISRLCRPGGPIRYMRKRGLGLRVHAGDFAAYVIQERAQKRQK